MYKTHPKYCLLVFGPETKTSVWLIVDGDVMYVDRNGNGDLTEKGERVQAVGSDLYRRHSHPIVTTTLRGPHLATP